MQVVSTIKQIAFLGDHLPRQCGIATFTTDICESIATEFPQCQCIVGAVNDRLEGYDYPPRIRFEIDEKELDSYRRAADFLNINNVEIVLVQHEYGIYGGPAGSHFNRSTGKAETDFNVLLTSCRITQVCTPRRTRSRNLAPLTGSVS